MINIITTFFSCIILALCVTFPAAAQTKCEGTTNPAYFSLYKNRQATFASVMDAGLAQRYKIECFIGGKSIGSVVKKSGESFVLKKNNTHKPVFFGNWFSPKWR